ncbi:MAG TPA: NAD-dependent epimerase/dehydratase family protein [Pirellulales bacterium]|jgi:threonine 3-dehydrogenase
MSKTCLITGGAGNLACQLSWHLASKFDRLLLVDLAARPVAATAPAAEYVTADVLDEPALGSLLARHRPTAIVHLASLLSGSCEHDRRLAWRVNCDGMLGLLELSLQHGVGTFLFPSSVASYGGELPDLLPEDAAQWPDGLYGVTKIAGERLGVYYQRAHGLDFRSLRLPIVVSRYAPPGAASAYASRAFIEAVQQGRFAFPVRPRACVSLMYVEDALRALVGLLEAPQERLSRRVYNVQSISPTAQEIAAAIQARLPHAELTFDPHPTQADLVERWPREVVDASARHDWGWQPRFDLETLADHFLEELQR